MSKLPAGQTDFHASPRTERSVLVIGAGVSGLSTALHLQDHGWDVRVIEQESEVGGVIRSTRTPEGFLAEDGPSEMLLKSDAVAGILHRAGLDASLQEANPDSRKRFLTRNGRTHPVPMSALSMLTTRLWSVRGRLRVLREPWVPPAPADAEESIADFVRRRLGTELFDYAIDPLVSGIFAGDPERLAMRHAFPRLHHLEQRHRSLIRGAIAQARERRRQGARRFRTRLISFQGGMQELPQALARALTRPPVTNARLSDLDHAGTGGLWSARWEVGGTMESGQFAAVVCAIPSHRICDLPLPAALAKRAHSLREIPYAPVVTVLTGYPRSSVAHPLDGFGVLHPGREQRPTLGTLFLSTLFPGRAPENAVSLLTFVGGRKAPDAVLRTDGEILDSVRHDHNTLLGASTLPSFQRIVRWPQAIPQYELGYQRFHDCMVEVETVFPGFYFSGNYRQGPGIGDCLISGRELAERMTARVQGER